MNGLTKQKALFGSLLTLMLGAGVYFMVPSNVPVAPPSDPGAGTATRVRDRVDEPTPKRDRQRPKVIHETREPPRVRPETDQTRGPGRVRHNKEVREKKKQRTPAC